MDAAVSEPAGPVTASVQVAADPAYLAPPHELSDCSQNCHNWFIYENHGARQSLVGVGARAISPSIGALGRLRRDHFRRCARPPRVALASGRANFLGPEGNMMS
jgi:hypothetical protein